ncbi:ABC transporter transmembrane domain-containing protein [Longispora albida]|uniref:ABC transporter transmembrane domain-containing protein n=1 Tax=Longispora albida TaxID=203523 RepID=UPI0009FDF8B9
MSDRVLGRGLRVLGQAIRDEPRRFTVAVLGSCLFGLMTIGSAYVVGQVIDRVIIPAFDSGHTTNGALAAGASAIFAVSMLKVLGIFGRRLGAGSMQFRLQASYRRKVTRRYLQLPLSWHAKHPTGNLLSNANSDVEAAWSPIAPFPFAVGTLVMLIGAVVSLFAVDWVLALVSLVVFPAVFTLNVVYSRKMSPKITRAQALRGEVSEIAHESFDGALVVKTMGREAAETERFAAKTTELRDALIQVGRIRGAFDPLMDALPQLGTLAILVVGGLRLGAGAVTVSDVVSVAFLFTVLAFPVRAIGWVLGELPRSVAGWDRLQNVITARGDMTYGSAGLPGSGPAVVRFKNVTFEYDGVPAIEDVSFTVPPGKTVALVGPTGAGKSTIASLAARLVDPSSGLVTIDGVDARELSGASLAGTVGLVPQLPFVFDDTIRGNITLGRDGLGDSDVDGALGLAQASGFVAKLPEGLDTRVGERGTSLSGGQRQRLTLARALAGGPRLLILDDATSAVDPRVEAEILAAVRAADASVLVVAYRRATIALADEVVYIEQGRVVATGTHEELLASVPGYIELVTAYEESDADRELEDA